MAFISAISNAVQAKRHAAMMREMNEQQAETTRMYMEQMDKQREQDAKNFERMMDRMDGKSQNNDDLFKTLEDDSAQKGANGSGGATAGGCEGPQCGAAAGGGAKGADGAGQTGPQAADAVGTPKNTEAPGGGEGAGSAGGPGFATAERPKNGAVDKIVEALREFAEGKGASGAEGDSGKAGDAGEKGGLKGKIDELIELLQEMLGKKEDADGPAESDGAGGKSGGCGDGAQGAGEKGAGAGADDKFDRDAALDEYSDKVDRAVERGQLTEEEGARLKGQMEGKASEGGGNAEDFDTANQNLDALAGIDSKADEVRGEIDTRVGNGELSPDAGKKAHGLIDEAEAQAKAAVLDGVDADKATGKTDAEVLSSLDDKLEKLDGDLNKLAYGQAEREAVMASQQKSAEMATLDWG